MKRIYRVLILIVVFIGALLLFANNIPQNLFSAGIRTQAMDNATFPVISFTSGGQEINKLHGYASNIDEMLIRNCITPVSLDKTFYVNIYENESKIKKLKYNLYDDTGEELENGTVLLLDNDEPEKQVKLTVTEPLKSGREYIVKITLVTDTGKRIYYYTRLKEYDNDLLEKKLDFVWFFHECLLDKNRYPEVEKYLEPKRNWDNTSFSNVCIHSSQSMVTWGDLDPEFVYMELPTVSEYYDGMASIRLDYIVGVQTGSGHEYYRVSEKFRFNYTSARIYLYDYDRSMEAFFDPALTSLAKSEFKLGITDADDVDFAKNESETLIAFSYNGEAWLYNVETNELIRVFSFRNGDYTEMRDMIPEHNVRLLQVTEEGQFDFAAYGYMNRGEYEGRVGILLYRYYVDDNRIEEQAYIPINCSYGQLCEELTSFMCRNEYDKFLFSVFDTIYSFDISKRSLSVIAEGVAKDRLLFDKELGYAAWQENTENASNRTIKILNVHDGSIITKESGNEFIRLMGTVEGNIVVGFSRSEDKYTYADGTLLLPAYRLEIWDRTGKILKKYGKENMYVTGISEDEHRIALSMVKKKTTESGFTYEEAEEDYIQNRNSDSVPSVGLSSRITNLTLTEYYVYLPEGVEMEAKPANLNARGTVLSEDTTLRINKEEKRTGLYYTYSFGEIVKSSDSAGEAVSAADEQSGTAISSTGQLVFERGVKSGKKEISGVEPISSSGRLTSVQACLKTIAAYKNIETDATDFDKNSTDVVSWLSAHMKAAPVDLTGTTVSEVLYYTYKNRLVMGFLKNETAVLITAYDASSVTYYDPTKNKYIKVSMKEAEELFAEGGNMFYSYID